MNSLLTPWMANSTMSPRIQIVAIGLQIPQETGVDTMNRQIDVILRGKVLVSRLPCARM